MGLIADSVYGLCTDAFVRRKRLQLIPTGRISENVSAVKTGTVNFFLYEKGSDRIAIDSGFGTSILKRELSLLGVDPNEITSLFLTHSDFDHAGGLPVFQNSAIYLSSREEPMITRRVARKYGVIYNRKISRAYRLLKNNDEVAVGAIKVKAIETPGHTPGSMSFLVNDEFLFVGDAFRLIDGKAHPNSPLYCMDTEQQEESIRKLAKLENIRWLFTAHGGCCNDFRSAMADWR